MILVAEANEYGSLSGLVQAASALAAVAVTIGALWWTRPKLASVNEALVKSGEVVLTAVGIVLLWTQFSELSSSRALVQILIRLAVVFVVSLFIVVTLGIVCALKREVGTDAETSEVGGFWLTKTGRDAVITQGSKQEAYAACAYQAATMWPLGSRLLAQGIFLVFDWTVAIAGSMAMAGAAMLLLMYQVPRIIEFSVAPAVVELNGTATLHWKISDNVTKVDLEPFGQVANMGDRPETIVKDVLFKLTATNTFGSRSIEQGVVVHQAAPPTLSPKTVSKSAENKGHKPVSQPPVAPDIVVESRMCALTEHVVIRGSGWLETDQENNSNAESRADCTVVFPTAGLYEMFVTYAAGESRPVRVTLNRKIIEENALAAATGGWTEPNELEQTLGVVKVNAGTNTVEFFSRQPIPHIQRIRFRRSS